MAYKEIALATKLFEGQQVLNATSLLWKIIKRCTQIKLIDCDWLYNISNFTIAYFGKKNKSQMFPQYISFLLHPRL